MRRLLERGQPTIQIVAEAPSQQPLPTMVSDFEAASRLGLQHLWDHGHRRIAILTSHHSGNDRTLEELRRLVTERGPSYSIEVAFADGEEAEALSATLELLSRKPSPSALFILSRLAAAHHAVRMLNLSVPSELAIVAFSDRDWLAYVEPPVTAIRHDSHGITSAMAGALESILSGERVEEPLRRVFQPKLIVRSSCGCKLA